MTVNLHFDEMVNYVMSRYNIHIEFKHIDDRTLEVSCGPNRLISRMAIQLRTYAMRRDIICLSYSCNDAMAMIIAGIVEHLNKDQMQGIEIETEEKRIAIYPERVNWLQFGYSGFTLEGILVQEDGLEFLLSFNTINQ